MLREDHYSDNNTDKIVNNDNLLVTPSSYHNNNTTIPSSSSSIPQLFKSLSSLSKFYKNHCVWPHCWASIVRQYHPIFKCNLSSIRRSHATCNRRRHFKLFNSLKPVRRLNKHKHRQIANHSVQHETSSIVDPQPIALVQQQPVTTTTTTTRIHAWTPPINYDTLKELSVDHIFKSLQLRHDLLFDPNLYFRPNLDGPSGREKRKKAERYWRRVDGAFKQVLSSHANNDSFEFLKIILQELARILVSLMQPFETSPASGTSFIWNWPPDIAKNQIHDALDAELIIQQIRHGFTIDNQVTWLSFIFEQLLCPTTQKSTLDTMKRYFYEQRYAKALKQCFGILEIIKLDCANRVLRHYRNFLLETCAEYEYRCLMKHGKKEFKIDSVYKWWKGAWKRYHHPGIVVLHHQNLFKDVYYAGLVHLVTDDDETTRALDLPSISFPVTLQFDERRLTHQFRYEFQNMIVIAIIMVPYRHLSGKYCDKKDIAALKQVYISLLKEAAKKDEQVSCNLLALHACNTAMQAHQRHHTVAITTLNESVKFWEEWLSHNLKPTSLIFKLMYDRICGHLIHYAQHDQSVMDSTSEVVGLEGEIESLGGKLKMVANLNLETFGVLYKSVAKFVQEDILLQ